MLPREAIPTIHALFASGACAAYARTAFPSVTAPSHAAIWTGAYGDVTGVTANAQPQLPRAAHTLLDLTSGYSAAVLRAEPFWISAASRGRRIVGHHVTQAPDAPGYAPVDRTPVPALDSARAAAVGALARGNLDVLNGYNATVSRDTVLTEQDARPRPAGTWVGVSPLRMNGAPPQEIAVALGGDSLHVLFYGVGPAPAYTHAVIAWSRDASRGVTVAAAPAEPFWEAGRPLARHFSPPLLTRRADGDVYLRARLFDLAPDGSRYTLFIPQLPTVQANRPEVAAAYLAATRGWVGNAAIGLYVAGRFGPTYENGGNGTAERRYLETAEYATRQSVLGADWAWRERRADLVLDYFSLGDEADHTFFGYTASAAPRYDADLARRYALVRERAWALVDHRLARLWELVRAEPGAALFVTGDHGMRATWRLFHPNVALRAAGLLAVDSTGRIDLARTRAVSPNGYWVSVNRSAWQRGIVPPAEERAVIAAAERALLAARGDDGRPVVTRTFRPADHDSLGLGGPTGGDLYYGVADGYSWTRDATGAVTSESPRVAAGHGFPSTASDMRTAFCAVGPEFPSRRIGPVRTIDVAPTVAEYLGVRPPAQATGRSVLGQLHAGAPRWARLRRPRRGAP